MILFRSLGIHSVEDNLIHLQIEKHMLGVIDHQVRAEFPMIGNLYRIRYSLIDKQGYEVPICIF